MNIETFRTLSRDIYEALNDEYIQDEESIQKLMDRSVEVVNDVDYLSKIDLSYGISIQSDFYSLALSNFDFDFCSGSWEQKTLEMANSLSELIIKEEERSNDTNVE